MNRFAKDVEVFENPCIGLVERIEDGQLDGEETAVLVRDCVQPMLDAGVDTLVLGCTHYPFIRPLLEQICQTNTSPEPVEGRSSTSSNRTIAIIDPAPAIARQTARLLVKNGLANDAETMGNLSLYTSGDPVRMTTQARQLLADKSLPKATHTAILPVVMGH
jgi:glutamate racemase